MAVILAIVKVSALLLCVKQVAAGGCPRAQTTLATFNAALIPIYPGQSGQAAIEERTPLLLQQVRS